MDSLPSIEYSLVPAFDDDGKETGYYTREPDGISGMTISALSEFCGLAAGSTSAISNLLKQIEQSSPETNTLSEALKPLSGKTLKLETNDLQGRLIVPDEVCQAVIEYYAFESRDYAGRNVAIANYRAIARAGIRVFIWTKTGFYPEALRPSLKSNTTVYIERLENIRDHKVPDDLWTTFREGAEILLLVEKEMGVPVEQMDLCDGSIGRHWSIYRQNKPWAILAIAALANSSGASIYCSSNSTDALLVSPPIFPGSSVIISMIVFLLAAGVGFCLLPGNLCIIAFATISGCAFDIRFHSVDAFAFCPIKLIASNTEYRSASFRTSAREKLLLISFD